MNNKIVKKPMKCNYIKAFLISQIILFFSLYTHRAYSREEFTKQRKERIITQTLLNQYDTRVVFFSFAYIDELSFLLSDSLLEDKKSNGFLFLEYIDELSQVKKDIVFNRLNSCFDSLSIEVRVEKLKKIESWCDCYYVFSYASNMCAKQNKEFSEIISEIEITARILNKFFVHEAQYWGSLSSSQDTVLFFEVVTYISSLTPNEQLSFYQEYFEKLKK